MIKYNKTHLLSTLEIHLTSKRSKISKLQITMILPYQIEYGEIEPRDAIYLMTNTSNIQKQEFDTF